MSFDWEEFIKFAKDFDSDSGIDECGCRVGISRAYYATYHCVNDYVKSKGIQLMSGGSSHERLWNSLKTNETSSNLRKLGADGDRLKISRKHADYDCDCSIDKRDLNKACILAENIYRQVKQLE